VTAPAVAAPSENRAAVVDAAVFLAAGALLLRHAAPSVTVGDSGEFITAAATLSLPHAPSYPLYTLAAKAFSLAVPWGDAAYRTNVFSAAAHAAAAALAGATARAAGVSARGGLFASVLLLAAPCFFLNGLVTEVFALNTALALAAALAAARGGARGALVALLLLALGGGNHHTLALWVPGLAWLAALSLRNTGAPRRAAFWGLAGGLAAAGLCVYLFLPLRSRAAPPLDWGNPETASGLYRTVTRQDYGTLSLSLGERLPRTAANGFRQGARFLANYRRQATAGGLLLAFAGWWVLWRRAGARALGWPALCFFSGPFFLWLGNPSFDAQSEGILERFYILPVAAGALAASAAYDAVRPRWPRASALLFLFPLGLLLRTVDAHTLRREVLVLDYSRNVLRSLPPGAAFFMDGGDDTFYSTAYQVFVRRARPDLRVFDRGGLIFAGAYGADFRRLDRDAKERRRRETESRWAAAGPLYYSTMNEGILPGTALRQAGFLYAAPPGRLAEASLWETYAFRSLYPTVSDEYRVRALAPYFPFMRGRALWREGRRAEAVAHLDRALRLGSDVPWLRSNLALLYLELGYDAFRTGDDASARALYGRCVSLDPRRADAMANLGTLEERSGRPAEAEGWYERALLADPDNVGALYNLAVVHWKRGDWDRVTALLERVLRLAPDHAEAARYLEAARRRAEAGAGR
jgi:tetratricopeptide (TPR) repeat protein